MSEGFLPAIQQQGGLVSAFQGAVEVAKTVANSDLIPSHYRGKTANCACAIQLSDHFGMHWMMFMQKTYIVHGNLAMEGQLVIAIINKYAPIKKRINWRFDGQAGQPKSSCTAFVIDEDGEELSVTLYWAHVTNEGWDKKNAKWKSMPDVMMRYRSAAMLGRAYFPDVLMGMYTVDEIEDIYGQPVEQIVIDNEPDRPKNKSDLADIIDDMNDKPETTPNHDGQYSAFQEKMDREEL